MPGLEAAYRQERDLLKIPVTLPHGVEIVLTAGGQNTLLKAMVEEFCPRFTPGGSVLYIGDAGDKWLAFEKEVLESLGVSIDDHAKMPDLVVHMEDRNWIVLLEAASTRGPVDSKRHIELTRQCEGFGGGLGCVLTLAHVLQCLGEAPAIPAARLYGSASAALMSRGWNRACGHAESEGPEAIFIEDDLDEFFGIVHHLHQAAAA